MEQPALYMTVLKINPNKTQSLEQINLYDVDFIETDKRRIVYHIGECTYHQIVSKAEIDGFLIQNGFDSLDRPNLVNLRKIRRFDEEYGKVYFVEHPDSKSKYTTVAKIKYSFIKKLLHRIVSHNNNTMQEVKLESPTKLKSMWKGLLERQ